MRCYVINLDRSPERWQHVLAEFTRQGLVPERIAAIDAARLPQDALSLAENLRGWKPMSASEIACFLSHRECWRLIAEGPDPVVAIFEDDIVLADGAASLFMNRDVTHLPCDVIKIESFNQPVLLSRRRRPFARSFHLHRLSSLHHGSAGYIVTREAARQLMALSDDRLPCQVDHFLFDPAMAVMARMRVDQLVPSLVMQAQLLPGWKSLFASTIRGELRLLPKQTLKASTKFRRERDRLLRQLSALPSVIAAMPSRYWQRLHNKSAVVPAHCRAAPRLSRPLDQSIGDRSERQHAEHDQENAGSPRDLGREAIR